MHFGFGYRKTVLGAQSRSIVVVDPNEMTDDIVRELNEEIVSSCAGFTEKKSAQASVPRRRSEAMDE
ncbi:hypothetical protein [Candidatus Methylacidithermus pantelleriae]|uniref:Uncharacterized protein n=1 Tax=Candidatus Methylacidithermus pantelleriae TaxID=2744239 RepID=A0A8J2BV49_9BACT|nr:hypothetical protein [Candidatus Methylacidithermus pantelleriae]CAF0703232.1 hypothetical protein MPNT_520008 [Candidatus Methylacidithermus pantelleriae]